jgi:hypothetical protein
MKVALLLGTLIGLLTVADVVFGTQAPAPRPHTSLGNVTLNRTLLADGQTLKPGTYEVRVTSDSPKPAPANRLTRRAM